MAAANLNLIQLIDQLSETDRDVAALRLANEDLANAGAFIDKLRGQADPVSKFLWSQFPAKTQSVLADASATAGQKAPVVVEALNRVLQDGALYDPQRFAGVSLPGEARQLIAQGAHGGALLRLNRLALDAAYPVDIRKLALDKLGRDSKFTGPDPDQAQAIFNQVLAGGAAALRELIGLIREPASPEFKSYKAEYLLHGLVMYAGGQGRDAQRTLLTEVLATQATNRQLAQPVRAFLVRELQLVGDLRAVTALGQCLAQPDVCAEAAAALVAIGDGAADQLRAALPKAQGRCRTVIVQNLGVLREAQALPELKQAVTDAEADVRLAAVWALARIGDAGAVPLLLKAADVDPSFERIKATQACLLLAENLTAAGQQAEASRIYAHLIKTRTQPKEQYVRELAQKALAAVPTL